MRQVELSPTQMKKAISSGRLTAFCGRVSHSISGVTSQVHHAASVREENEIVAPANDNASTSRLVPSPPTTGAGMLKRASTGTRRQTASPARSTGTASNNRYQAESVTMSGVDS